jgi:hypothetical protein
LKGGFALDLRLSDRARTTKDIDIEWQGGEDDLHDALLDAAGYDAGDYFTFEIERVGIPEDAWGGSHRFRVEASLAGRLFETVLLDAGSRADIESESVQITSHLLEFADVGAVKIDAIPLEQHLTEKGHAYTRTYESGHSTRAKDLVDIVLIETLYSIDAAKLRKRLEATFAQRDTHPLPDAFPSPPASWLQPYAQLADDVGVDQDLGEGFGLAGAFLDPILAGRVADGVWDPDQRRWTTSSAAEGLQARS